MFERLSWINLDKRLDRKLRMEQLIGSSHFLQSCQEIQRYAPKLPDKLLTPRSFPVHAGHYSCLRAHLTVIEQAYADGLQNVLILEDDIDLEADFEQQMPVIIKQLPKDWLMLYLGGTSQHPHHSFKERLSVLGGATSTHAYALSREGMEVCVDWLFREEKHAIDQMYNRLHQERLRVGDHRCLCVQPWIVHTLDGYSELDQRWTQGTRTCPHTPAAPPTQKPSTHTTTNVDEELLKAAAFGGADKKRSEHAFQHIDVHSNTGLQALLKKDVFQPATEEVLASSDQISRYCKSGKIKVLIPMRELQADVAPIIGETIDTLIDHVGVENIYISDNGLHQKVEDAIRGRGITLFSVNQIKERFNFTRLLEVLSLKKLDFGLGFSFTSGLAGLLINQCMEPDDWLVKFDGDISNFKQCLLFEHLLYPLAVTPQRQWDYLKTAKVGRNNDTVIAGINSLTAFALGRSNYDGQMLAPQAEVAREIYQACIRQIWILSGQYAIRWKYAYNQLSSTGYCAPLLHSMQSGWRNMAQVVNPHPLLDAPNTKQKEDSILTHCVQFINALVAFGKSVREDWGVEDVARFNHQLARHQNAIAWIPEQPGPMQLESIEPDRLFPSLNVLIKEGLLE